MKPLRSLGTAFCLTLLIISMCTSTYNVNAITEPRANSQNDHLQSIEFDDPNVRTSNDGPLNDFTKVDEGQIETFTIKMPQLNNREKQIIVFLPQNYKFDNTRYPVLYLQNAQEVFTYSFTENYWSLNESLYEFFISSSGKDVIIVGSLTDSITAWNEYSPWVNDNMYAWMDPYDANRVEGGDGDAYLEFLIHTLKPEIDIRYRTLTDRANTFIGGIHMGGLLSLSAGITKSDIYSQIMAVSPSIWFAEEGGVWLSDNRLLSLIETINSPDNVLFIIDITPEDRTTEIDFYPVIYDSRGDKLSYPQAYLEGVQQLVITLVDKALPITNVSGGIQDPNEWTEPFTETFDRSPRGAFDFYLPLIYSPQIPPRITSTNTTTFFTDESKSFTITTTGDPKPVISIKSGTLPDGLTLEDNENGTATISGKAQEVGAFPLIILADNAVSPAYSQSFKLLVADSQALVCPSNDSCVLSFDITMNPYLDRTRKIWVYLPPNYNNSGLDYQVIYLTDAQHIFGAEANTPLSYPWDWEFDETLDELYKNTGKGTIAVGIEYDAYHPWDEYTPWNNYHMYNWLNVTHYNFGSNVVYGKGDNFLDFIVYELKPFVDSIYRTKPEREYTAIGGGSRCALFSIYAGLREPDHFSRVMNMSAAVWLANDSTVWLSNNKLLKWFDNHQASSNVRYYMYVGKKESGAGGYPLNGPEWYLVYIQGKHYTREKLIADGVLASNHWENAGPNYEGTHYPGRWGAHVTEALKWFNFY